jgi:hypothetical protein
VYDGPRDEYIPLLAACLREHGWPAEIRADGGLSVDSLADDQRQAFMAARGECEAEIGSLPPAPPLDEEQIRQRYEFLLGARQCLIDLGYPISDPPTVETFIETYATGPWSPFNDLADQTTSEHEWLEANERCPQS